jgi:hypothetical protein
MLGFRTHKGAKLKIVITKLAVQCIYIPAGKIGEPEGPNHVEFHTKGASSWLPNTEAHGMLRVTVGARACCQCCAALGFGRLLAVTKSPK